MTMLVYGCLAQSGSSGLRVRSAVFSAAAEVQWVFAKKPEYLLPGAACAHRLQWHDQRLRGLKNGNSGDQEHQRQLRSAGA